MTFDEIFDQIITLLKTQGRVSYGAIKRRFDLDDDYLEDLKTEIIEAQQLAVDENGRLMVWVADTASTQGQYQAEPTPTQQPANQADRAPQTEPRSEPPIPDAERRQLTVMFCDLADSTKLSGQLDPEDLRDVIRAYQSTSAEVVERYDGYIAQHLGDGLMVYFGWPQAHEDDARRAVHAGLGILEAMRALNVRLGREKGIRLAVRIGIHTGLVVVGEIGKGASQEHLALGETPNVASRIESAAEVDTVAISDATYQLVQGYFVCADLGQYTLKGVGDARCLYRVVKESAAQSRLDVAATRGLTPLVGRESEVTLLLERWEQVKADQGQVILLSGEAGIGKSRLLQALKDSIANELHTLQECRCSPYHSQSAFYPLIDLLQRKLDWRSDDTSQDKLHKLETVLTHTHLEVEQAVPLFSSLLSLPLSEDQYAPLMLSSQRQRQDTLEALLQIVLLTAEQHPVLFIVEDLHWIDPSTLEFLELLMQQAATTAILTVLTCRPEFVSPWGLRSYLTPIALNRLTRPQIEQMVARVTGGKAIPTEVMRQLVEKTDGVPLYIEEMTKAVLETGVLREVEGGYELTDAVLSLAIPATLQDSLMARLDRLGSAKAVAQYGAVIGRQFSYDLLRQVAQLDETMLQQALERLVESELLYQRGLPPQAIYTFKHALIHDAAHESLLKRTRQQYHQRIAQVLEAQSPETAEVQPELLAHHYTQADRFGQAVVYWQQAGERASARSAYIEAVAHLRKGLDVLQHLPATTERARQELTLQLALAESLSVVEGYSTPALEPVYQRAREVSKQLDETLQLVSTLQLMRRYYMMRLDLETARELGVELLDLAQRQPDAGALQEAHWGLGQTLYFIGDMAGSRTHLEQSSAAYVPQPLTSQAGRDLAGTQVACHVTLGRPVWALGYPDQARTYTRQGLSLAKELAHPFTQAFAHYAAALNHFFRRDVHEVLEQIEASLALGHEHDFPVWIAWGTFLRGWAFAMQGRIDEGLSQMHDVLISHQEMIDESARPPAFVMLAEVRGLAGRAREGLQALDELLGLVEKTGGRFWEAEIYRLKGQLLSAPNVPPPHKAVEVEACFQKALSIARAQQAKSWELRAATSLARLWQSQGKRQDAYDLLAPVYGWFTEGFDTADLQDAKALLEGLA